MEFPTDRVLIMVIAITGFAVLSGAWISGFLEAQAGLPEAWIVRAIVAIAFLAILGIFWTAFTRMDRKRD